MVKEGEGEEEVRPEVQEEEGGELMTKKEGHETYTLKFWRKENSSSHTNVMFKKEQDLRLKM